jgi:transcription initiation factor TFIIIB Brf1 subunit/transcription initiation factor TFIIB
MTSHIHVTREATHNWNAGAEGANTAILKSKRAKMAKRWNEFAKMVDLPFDVSDISEQNVELTSGQLRPKEREYCNQCGEMVAISSEGYNTCTNRTCGAMHCDVLNFAPEWRYYGDDGQNADPARCGMPADPLFDDSLTTCKLLTDGGRMSGEMRRIQCKLTWAMSYKDKAQYEGFQQILSSTSSLGIPKKITDDAFKYYKKIFDSKNSFRGINRDSIIAASIYISYRINNFPQTVDEIAKIFHLNNAATTKGCKQALEIINLLEKNIANEDKTVYCMAKPSHFIARYCNKLEIRCELTMLCKFICLKLEYLELLQENTPQSIAAGVLFFVICRFNIGITKKNISAEIDLSEVTIAKCATRIGLMEIELVPRSVLKKYALPAITRETVAKTRQQKQRP